MDKSDEGLAEIISAVEQFEEDRFLAGLQVRRHTVYDIQQASLMVREYQQKMNREVLALSRFSETFIQEYATDNNKCFETAQRLFNRIRSTISASRRVFRKTCPIVRKPVADRPSVFRRSVLSYAQCQRDLFGVSTYDDAVRLLYEDLQTFFTTVIGTLLLCRQMIQAEQTVRQDESQCLAIWRDCRDKALSGVKELALEVGVAVVPDNELTKRRSEAKSLGQFAQDNYHRYNTTEFKMSVIIEAVRQARNDGLTDDEARLWPDDHEKALRVRQVIAQIDDISGAEGQKGKLNGTMLVEFIKWCEVPRAMEKNLYETYFCTTYKGRLKLPVWNTLSKVRKDHEELNISDEAERESFERRLTA